MLLDEPTLSGGPRAEQRFPCSGHLRMLFDRVPIRVFPPHQMIFSQDEFPHFVCFICHGVVKLTRTESDVSRMIVGLRRKGWMLGATALLVGMPYPATAETVTRSKLCFIPVETFKQAMEMNARFSRWVSVILSREVNCGTLNISEKGCLSGRRRLEKFLWDTIHDQTGCHPEKAIKILLPLKFWEIAQLIALTPEHLCRLFKKMETEGIVLKKNGWLLIPEPKKLYHPDVPSHVYSQQTW